MRPSLLPKLFHWIPLLLLLPYAAYLYIVVIMPFGPVDFETFRDIGSRLLANSTIYTWNTYYPMPYIGIFGLLALLPRWLAAILWMGVPVVLALVLFGPWTLAYAPLFTHFLGQTAVFGMLALWALYRKPASRWTPVILAVATIKPQLAIVPVLWSLWRWWQEKNWKHALLFSASVALIWLPWFLLRPNWITEWLSYPRPLSLRAITAIVPRVLLLSRLPAVATWSILLLLTAVVIFLLRGRLTLKTWVLLWFILCPLVHDYDLVQLLPLLDTRHERIAAIAASIPMWLVILFDYNSTSAWIVTGLIAPVVLLVYMTERKSTKQEFVQPDPM